jgi:hypothetical protein
VELEERIQKLRLLNPQLEGRTHCTGRLLIGVDTSPHKPDETEYEYVSVCEK